MSFFAVLLALAFEQLRPLPSDNTVHDGLLGWVRWTARNLDAGKPTHAWVVWIAAVLTPAVVIGLVYWSIARYSVLLALLWNVVVLYFTLGFRQFSHRFTDIRDALERADEPQARRLLAQWQRVDASELPRSDLLRHIIEYSLLAAHRHVFAVFFWFVALSSLGLGPSGAVLYRLADLARRYWLYKSRIPGVPVNESLVALSQQMYAGIDHVPARLTAAGFAAMGNFEEAVNGWRRDTALWPDPNEGVILAAAAGAVGVQLGGAAAPSVDVDRTATDDLSDAGARRPDPVDSAALAGSTPGVPAQFGHLNSVVGLVWRSVVLWMLLLALLSVARVVG